MIDHSTRCSLSTSARTRIHAFVVQTSLAAIAVCIRDTFWPASCVWIADVFRKTSTRSDTVSLVADRVRSTWGWIAWCTRLFGCGRFFHYRYAFGEWIASVSSVANTNRIMFHDITISIYSTRAWARIHALFVLTGKVSRTCFVDDAFRSTIRCSAHIIR